MAPKQRMRLANDKAAKNVTQRGNVPKTTVSQSVAAPELSPHTYVFVYLPYYASQTVILELK